MNCTIWSFAKINFRIWWLAKGRIVSFNSILKFLSGQENEIVISLQLHLSVLKSVITSSQWVYIRHLLYPKYFEQSQMHWQLALVKSHPLRVYFINTAFHWFMYKSHLILVIILLRYCCATNNPQTWAAWDNNFIVLTDSGSTI